MRLELSSFLLLALLLGVAVAEAPDTCEVARLKCAYRVGCGRALHNYMMGCSDIMAGRTTLCSDLCKKSLIAVTSTDEGQALMMCDCGDNEFCVQTKQRVEVCRPDVVRATDNGSVVSCSVAQWICAADPLCSTALQYYHRFCRSMIHGRKCTPRCNNSISILNRQDKAAKLRTCICDGSEDYDCFAIKRNMDRLCFRRSDVEEDVEDDEDGEQQHSPTRTFTSSAGRIGLYDEHSLYLFLMLLILFIGTPSLQR